MFETLFGADVPLALKFFLAFVVVLALIGATAWAVRRFGSDRLGSAASRNRQPRLAVVDAASVDSRRRLVIIRRDNVEHLLMIGGPTDVVVESNIVRAVGAQREPMAPAPARAAGDTLTRPVAVEGTTWPSSPEPAPAPAPVVRPPRPVVAAPVVAAPVAAVEDQPQWPPPPAPEPPPRPQLRRIEPRPAEPRVVETRPSETLAELANELSSHPPTPIREVTPVQRAEPPRAPAAEPAPAEAAAAPQVGDQSLAEMAQRLEAALRRPGGQNAEAKSAPAAEQRLAAPPVPPPPQRPAKASEPPPAAAKPAAEAKPKSKQGDAKDGKNIYESLEQEMASLLGRAQGKG